MEQVDKRYPGVHALDQVDFDLYPGEVHVLLGENGAGKSTLVKILAGSVRRDAGRLTIQGQQIDDLTPERAQALGIGMVYQELSLVPRLSAAENIFLGRPPRSRLGLVDWRAMVSQAEESLRDLGVEIDVRRPVAELPMAEQQLTEVARVLAKQPGILLLDEPTSALSDRERERLFRLLDRLRRRGVGVVYISHRLAEVPLVGQRVTVLRDGRVVGTLPVSQADEATLVRMMVGRRLAEQYPKQPTSPGEPILRLEGLSVEGSVRDVSLELRRGEVVGVFGLMGAGQEQLARAIFGLLPLSSGRIFIDGREAHIRSPTQAIAHGLGFLVRDRREGLVPMLPIPPNITLARLSQSPAYALLDLQEEGEAAAGYVRELGIQPPILERPVLYLSGGNQQKVILARWLFSQARVLLFDEPTRGIDVGAKAEVFALMNRLVARGVGILMISSEMPELLAMADRILVMKAGRIQAHFEAATASQEHLLRAAS